MQLALWDLALNNHSPKSFGLDSGTTYSSGDSAFAADLGGIPEADRSRIAAWTDKYLKASAGATTPGAWLDAAAQGDYPDRGQSLLLPGALAAAGATVAATEGQSFQGQVATFTDLDPSGTPATYTATIDWGDGSSPSAGDIRQPGGPGTSFVVTGGHTFAEEGSGPVQVTITDTRSGSSVVANGTAAVADAPLSAAGGTVTYLTGSPFRGVVASFTDANPGGMVGDFSAQINWGDGTPPSAGTVEARGKGFVILGEHTFQQGCCAQEMVIALADKGGAKAEAKGQAAAVPAESDSSRLLSLTELRDIVLDRLKDAQKSLPQLKIVENQIKEDFANLKNPNDPALRARLIRLNDTLFTVQPVLESLNQLAKKENYLPDLADKITKAVTQVRDKYAAALLIAYSDQDPKNEVLAEAGKAMAQLPPLITGLYLSKKGLPKLIQDLNIMLLNLDQLRGLTKDATRDADDIFFVPQAQGGTAGYFNKQLKFVDDLYKQKDPNAFARMLILAGSLQDVVTVVGALLWYEQFRYWDQLLTGPSDAHTLAADYKDKLDAILKKFEKAHKDKDVEAFQKAGDDLKALLADPKFDEATKTILERAKKEEQVKAFVKQVVIIVVSAALTRGATGLVGAGLKGRLTVQEIQAVSLLVEAASFTSATAFGQYLVFGEAPSTSQFFQEMGWNALMFGTLRLGEKAFTNVVTRIAGNPENFKTLGQLATGLGRFGTALVTLQGFNELQTALKQGRLATDEERFDALIQNVALMATLHIAGVVTRPLEKMLGDAVLGKLRKNYAADVKALEKQQADLLDLLVLQQRGQLDAAGRADVSKRSQQFWNDLMALLNKAEKKDVLGKPETQPILNEFVFQVRALELQLAQLKVLVPVSPEVPLFRPVELREGRGGQGMILYKPEALSFLKEFYRRNGGTFGPTTIWGEAGYKGTLNGKTTFFKPDPGIGLPLTCTAEQLKLSDAELESAKRFMKEFGITLYRWVEGGKPQKNSAFEFIDDWGRTYDQQGNPDTSAQWAEQRDKFLKQIPRHLQKADFLILDLTGFEKSQIKEVRDFINKNVSKEDQARIKRLGF